MVLFFSILMVVGAIGSAYRIGCWHAFGYAIGVMCEPEEIIDAIKYIRSAEFDAGYLRKKMIIKGLHEAMNEKNEEDDEF